MLKKIIYITIALYLLVHYGQNAFVFGSGIRADFYFTGMAIVNLLESFIIFKLIKSPITSFYLFMRAGQLYSELFSSGSFHYLEIVFGVIGFLLVMFESKIKELWK